ncbi:MAG: hypothetical protein MMC33_003195 [Icmadophila ericetorum]|nr:hypothetical protein [Icmadophila ericetorum]
MTLSPVFQKAVEDLNKLKEEPSADDRLRLYGLYKIAHNVESQKPSRLSYDMKAKYKYNAWKELKDSGITSEEAQEQYVELANALIQKIGFA